MPARFPTRVSENRRFLVCDDNTPFFYLGDTAWELFHRLDRNETNECLQDRAVKGFTVVQAVALAECDGLRMPNRSGEVPFHDLDPTRPNEAYFEHIDWVIGRANALGLCVALLPTWGDKWNLAGGLGPVVFTPKNAAIYGEWLGRRYRDAGLIWVLGGDRRIETDEHRAIITNMAYGLRRGDKGHHLMTFHPCGAATSSTWFHAADWLDFNMCQTGHVHDRPNYQTIAADYDLSPTKPCMDGEPGYEDIPADFKVENKRLSAIDTRRSLYWALFAGAHGHSYGAHSIWQFWEPGHEPLLGANRPWRESLQLPGASQMQHARRLLESRPFLSRLPDQSLILEGQGEGAAHLQATRDRNGNYALIYFANGGAATIDLGKISGKTVRAHWFDPRTGTAHRLGDFKAGSPQKFVSPSRDEEPDWVLVLDDKDCHFAMLNMSAHHH